jgi:hypothetical protein
MLRSCKAVFYDCQALRSLAGRAHWRPARPGCTLLLVPTAGQNTEARVFFRDIKPYEAPGSLADLRGPATDVVELPHSVLWAPGSERVDLQEPGDINRAYQAVLCEGTATDQIHLLNRQRLITVWPDLMLPVRVRDLWESRFPQLRRSATA